MQAYENSAPTAWMMGKVISASPLKIEIEQRLTIDEDLLILTRNVTDYKVAVRTSWETGSAEAHSHGITGGSMTVRNALREGEAVLLLRQEGGQKFVVLDRVVI